MAFIRSCVIGRCLPASRLMVWASMVCGPRRRQTRLSMTRTLPRCRSGWGTQTSARRVCMIGAASDRKTLRRLKSNTENRGLWATLQPLPLVGELRLVITAHSKSRNLTERLVEVSRMLPDTSKHHFYENRVVIKTPARGGGRVHHCLYQVAMQFSCV